MAKDKRVEVLRSGRLQAAGGSRPAREQARWRDEPRGSGEVRCRALGGGTGSGAARFLVHRYGQRSWFAEGHQGNHPEGHTTTTRRHVKLIDANVVIYSVGKPHDYRDASRRVIRLSARRELDVTVDTEELQEVLNHYHRQRRTEQALEVV